MAKYCKYCGTEIKENFKFCDNCGANLEEESKPSTYTNTSTTTTNPESKSRIVAGILGIFLGGWGIHNFYLGFNSKGVTQIVVSLLTCGLGALWGFVEGILILCGSINVDANGVELSD